MPFDFNAALRDNTEKQITVRDPLDPAPLLEAFAEFELPLAEMDAEARALTVTDDASSKRCAEMAAQCGKLSNVVKKRITSVLTPFKGVVDAVNRGGKSIYERADKLKSILEQKNLNHLAEKKRQKEEADRLAREEAARLQREAEAKAKEEADRLAAEARAKAEAEGKDKAQQEAEAQMAASSVVAAPVIVPEVMPETRHRTDSGSQGLQTVRTWEVADIVKFFEHVVSNNQLGLIRMNMASHDPANGYKKNSEPIHVFIGRQVDAGANVVPGVVFRDVQIVKTRSK